MNEEGQVLDEEIAHDESSIDEGVIPEDEGTQEEPEYDAGNPSSEEGEPEQKQGIENAGIRRKREREKRKAAAAKDDLLRELLESQRTLAEQVRRLSTPAEADDTPEIDQAQKHFAKSIMKEAIMEFVQDGERSKEEIEEEEYREQAYREAQIKKEREAECVEMLEEAPSRFGDFEAVISTSGVEFNNVMTECLTRVGDPAAFLYNSCKYHKSELAKIARISDPIEQIQAMGALTNRIMNKITPKRTTDMEPPMSMPRSSMRSAPDDYNSVAYQHQRMTGGKAYRD